MIPNLVPNWIAGRQRPAEGGESFEKLNPSDGTALCRVARSRRADVAAAVAAARAAQEDWAQTPAVRRGLLLHELVLLMKKEQDRIAAVVSAETGKSRKDALGEAAGAVALGLFYASEGQRLYGRTTTSAVADKSAMTIRCPLGVAGLIVAANTPIANVAWKAFPALVCGNTAVLKAAEDTPATAWLFGELAQRAGFPDGALNIVQGYGEEAGAPLAEHPDVAVVSFTGSTEVGRFVQRAAGERFARVSLELGGKNAFVVCDDADLELAARWAALSAFSNAGQRCASAGRIIVFESVYEPFKKLLLDRTAGLRVGIGDEDDFGPVINEGQLAGMLEAVAQAARGGAQILCGGKRLEDPGRIRGFYMAPTLIEGAGPGDPISRRELFGPIAVLYRVRDFQEALALTNDSPYGLTASIHTKSLHRAVRFYEKAQTGVVTVNAGTYGSEPHMPFGGCKHSGNGSREPGTEALDVYSELKDVYINIDPKRL